MKCLVLQKAAIRGHVVTADRQSKEVLGKTGLKPVLYRIKVISALSLLRTFKHVSVLTK